MKYKNNYGKRILICNSIKGKNKAEIGQIYKINWISKDGQSIHLEETYIKEKFRIAKIVLYQNNSFIKNDYYLVSKTELMSFLSNEFGNNTFKSLDVTTKLREYIDHKCRAQYKEFTYKLRNETLTHLVIKRLILSKDITVISKENNRKIMVVNSEG